MLMYNARVVLLRGEVKLLLSFDVGWFFIPSLYPPISLFYLPKSWSIKMINKTLASTSPYYALTTHHIFSSSVSNICRINYLYFSRVNLAPVVKYGVKFTNWLEVYLPGGKSKFYNEFDSANVLFFYMFI